MTKKEIEIEIAKRQQKIAAWKRACMWGYIPSAEAAIAQLQLLLKS